MRAWAHQLGIAIDGTEAARLCQIAENQVVGAPCGIMDQMTSALGSSGELLALLCQPAEVQGTVRLPDSLSFWGIDSGIRHAVSGSDYTSVRTGAFMGYRMIASMAGLEVTAPDSDSVVRVRDSRWHGYLANLTPVEFEKSYAAQLPDVMAGAEFLSRYQGTSDLVTQVEPERMYSIRQPTAHPIYEHSRVRRFRDLLAKPLDEPTLIEMGELMYASHQSYSACGLGSSGTDRLVDMVRRAGPASGLFGAKITGGGSGGTVAILGLKHSGDAVERIAERYADETGHEGYVFRGSSPGAWNEEVRTVRL
jgi:L-arabinokinase